MIVYEALKSKFLDDVLTNTIEEIVYNRVKSNAIRGGSPGELRSWKESLPYMERILQDKEIPDDCGVAIEFKIPMSEKRVDFLITGLSDDGAKFVVLIELKQWQDISTTDKDAIVVTYVGKKLGEHLHPSYQVWTYSALLEGFNEAIEKERINLKPCAYLHNYSHDNKITDPFYRNYIEKAPLFLKTDAIKLRDFIKKYIKRGDQKKVLYDIENGNIRPSKGLADSIASMIKGNKEFLMIDDQKIVYEKALALAKQSNIKNKNVYIVEGGPGTGKSVVAVNLLTDLTKLGLTTLYVSKNAAPRAVYVSKLTGTLKQTVINNLFKGSGSFINEDRNFFDTLIVDEAHRLNEKSGLYGNLGENQIREIISSSKFSIFFIDEDQRVTLKDIGRKEAIKSWANHLGATVYEDELTSQFRCNGSDGYLSWLDSVLQIRETPNLDIKEIDFDFRVFNNPNELREVIVEKNKINNKARMVAGYCWKWITKKHPDLFDVTIPEFGFKMKWNLTQDGSLWIISPKSINEIGCIHTCQGLEVDYIGVIIGNDFVVRNGKVLTRPQMRASTDMSLRGFQTLIDNEPISGRILVDKLIKNTYRTLMTRGMKGCYVYFTDKETEAYFNNLNG